MGMSPKPKFTELWGTCKLGAGGFGWSDQVEFDNQSGERMWEEGQTYPPSDCLPPFPDNLFSHAAKSPVAHPTLPHTASSTSIRSEVMHIGWIIQKIHFLIPSPVF